MGSAKKMFTKLAKSTGIIKENKFAQTMVKAGAELEAGRDPQDKPTDPEQTKAQTGAAAARKKRGGRVGQRGLLYASRLGGGGAGRGENQDTLGSA